MNRLACHVIDTIELRFAFLSITQLQHINVNDN